MQYFFEKSAYGVQWCLGQSPRSWGVFENFCVKSNLTVCKITFNCTAFGPKPPEVGGVFENFCVKSNLTGKITFNSTANYRKMGEQDALLTPNNFVGGAGASTSSCACNCL